MRERRRERERKRQRNRNDEMLINVGAGCSEQRRHYSVLSALSSIWRWPWIKLKADLKKSVSIKYSKHTKACKPLKEKYWNIFLHFYNSVQNMGHHHLYKSLSVPPWTSYPSYPSEINHHFEFDVIILLFMVFYKKTTHVPIVLKKLT